MRRTFTIQLYDRIEPKLHVHRHRQKCLVEGCAWGRSVTAKDVAKSVAASIPGSSNVTAHVDDDDLTIVHITATVPPIPKFGVIVQRIPKGEQ